MMTDSTETLTHTLVDLENRRIVQANLTVADGKIGRIDILRELSLSEASGTPCVLPGFVDAHVHVESSMLTPAQFARMAVRHGTVATVSDPHEIANVLGIAGIEFMLESARAVPLKIHFGAPSCVPATAFESAGACLDASAVAALLARPDIHYLTEVMNFPGLLAGDADLAAKVSAARLLGKPIDGHAPGLRGAEAARYFSSGPTTDHECTTLDEALDKIAEGAHILIREGSAARNFDALHPLLRSHPARCMFCSDDKHPDELLVGHIDRLVARAVALGHDLFDVLDVACVNPVKHYGLNVGMLRIGDPADFIEIADLASFRVLRTWIDGNLVAENGTTLFDVPTSRPINRFECRPQPIEAFAIAASALPANVIVARCGQIVTGRMSALLTARDGLAVASIERDLLKIAVVNRYNPDAPPAVAFIHGFGLRRGAIASSVAHDSHNIIAVGVNDLDLMNAINAVLAERGGLSAVDGGRRAVLPLPVAGLMSDLSGETVSTQYQLLDTMAREMGCTLRAPFMTLSFMALLVIPELKLSDLGLFDADAFRPVGLYD